VIDFTLTNEPSGTIYGSTGVDDGGNGDAILNLGTIQGTSTGVSAGRGLLILTNSRAIFGAYAGFNDGSFGSSLSNTGSIDSNRYGIELSSTSSATTTVANAGSISGRLYAIYGAGFSNALFLTNTGTIGGDILLGNAADTVVNKGLID